jgi:methyl-accepting chemotaxis protein
MSEKTREECRRTLARRVERSSAMIEQVISATEVFRASSDVSGRTESIAAAVEQLAATSASISDNCKIAAKDAREALEAADAQVDAAIKARAIMDSVREAVDDATGRLDRLSEASNRISQSIEEIASIARQTNLLALNASIEAARAGEAGKGFAVVAAEVRDLAEKAGDAAREIRTRVSDMTTSSSEIASAMRAASGVVSESDEAMSRMQDLAAEAARGANEVNAVSLEINETVETQSVAAEEISQNIQMIAANVTANLEAIQHLLDRIDADQANASQELDAFADADLPNKTLMLAKTDHLMWRKRLSAMVVGRERDIDAAKLADFKCCRFGKWYGAQRGEAIAGHPAYAAIDAPHRLVHLKGVEAVECYARGDLDGALARIAEVSEASVEVLRLLDVLAEA